MTPEDRRNLVDRLLLTVQNIRRNMVANECRMILDAAAEDAGLGAFTDEQAELFLTPLFPWVWGPSSIMHPLSKLATRTEPPTAMEVYNLLFIAHLLDKTGTIKKGYFAYYREYLPQADLRELV